VESLIPPSRAITPLILLYLYLGPYLQDQPWVREELEGMISHPVSSFPS
jgi:hypothetical protein